MGQGCRKIISIMSREIKYHTMVFDDDAGSIICRLQTGAFLCATAHIKVHTTFRIRLLRLSGRIKIFVQRKAFAFTRPL